MPFLNTPDDIDGQLAVFAECFFPVRRDGFGQGQEARDAADHHFTHGVVFGCVCVDVLHAAEARVGFVVVVPGADGFDDVISQFCDAESLTE